MIERNVEVNCQDCHRDKRVQIMLVKVGHCYHRVCMECARAMVNDILDNLPTMGSREFHHDARRAVNRT